MQSEQQHKSTLQIFALVFTCGIGSFYFGYEMGVFNLALNTLDH